jgi:hypothetical protein
MSRITFAFAVMMVLGLPLSSQSFAAHVSASREVGGALPFEIPTFRIKAVQRPAAGRRLYIISITLGEEPIETEARRFLLVAGGTAYEPIGAGADADSIVPFDRIPEHREVGVILPSDAMILLTRESATRVLLEVGPLGTVAFLYELPDAAPVRALRLPDGRELATP